MLSADILPAFLKKFSMYVLRSKVKLADASADTVLLGVSGAKASTVLAARGSSGDSPRAAARIPSATCSAAAGSSLRAWPCS